MQSVDEVEDMDRVNPFEVQGLKASEPKSGTNVSNGASKQDIAPFSG
jgi:hypothetical protein